MSELTGSIGYQGAERPALPDLDTCTRCGQCLEACPTYRVLRFEPDSPRGRIFLMKQVADGDAGISEHLAEHLYVCLGCRACETACPSGVPYGRLLEYGRHQVEMHPELMPKRRGWHVFRSLAFEKILPNKAAFALALAPARMLQRSPALAALLTALPLTPRVRDLFAMVPRNGRQAPQALPEVVPAEGTARARVALFTGCIMDALFSHVHEATTRVLRHNGCEVVIAGGQWCCGALNVHAGERRFARAMARRNVEAFEKHQVDAIVVNSAGCGAILKEYGELLGDEPAYAERARNLANKVKDISEYLCELGIRTDFGVQNARVTYQDACHLAHAQRIREQPRQLLRMLPGIEYVELSEADRCCGAAGVYSLTNREMSQAILAEKLDLLAATRADFVVTGNPGCHMQLQAGLARRRLPMKVRHLTEVLDAAYAASPKARPV